jgi:DNA-binding LytR/AlgR family response regulator
MKTRCMIVDDEPLAIEAIQMHIEKFESLKLVTTCTDAIQAFDQLRTARIDLMFLDIQMPEMTGLDFLKSLKNPPKVIFTTAYREYAIQAFDLDVVDYLLKPISFERFMQAINKFFEGIPKDIISPDSQVRSEDKEGFFYVRSDKKNVKIKYANMYYIESIKDYVKIVCKGKTIISKIMIGNLAEQLPEKLFIRTHRSYIVYIPNIEAFSSISVEIPGKEIPIGRNYKNETLNTLRHSF